MKTIHVSPEEMEASDRPGSAEITPQLTSYAEHTGRPRKKL